MLKALAKNPDNRYQTAAEMRADLVRVHNGERAGGPQGAHRRRADLDAGRHAAGRRARETTDALPRQSRLSSSATAAGGSIGRWLVAVALLADPDRRR